VISAIADTVLLLWKVWLALLLAAVGEMLPTGCLPSGVTDLLRGAASGALLSDTQHSIAAHCRPEAPGLLYMPQRIEEGSPPAFQTAAELLSKGAASQTYQMWLHMCAICTREQLTEYACTVLPAILGLLTVMVMQSRAGGICRTLLNNLIVKQMPSTSYRFAVTGTTVTVKVIGNGASAPLHCPVLFLILRPE